MKKVGTREPSSGPTVVYLHPDPAVGAAVAAALQTDSLTVYPVEHAETARELIEERAIDCLVTAYDLPTTDGISLLRSLRADELVTPVILHVAHGDESIAAEAIDADVSGYVPIPDSPTETVADLSEALADAIEETESTAALRRRWQTVESLHDVALEFESCDSPEETYQFAVEALAQVLAVHTGVIYVAEDDALVPKATVGTVPGGWEPYGLEEGVAGRTFQTGESNRTDHIQAHDDASPAEDTVQSGISVPVGDFGVLQAVSIRAGAYTEHDQKLAELLAAHVSAAVSRIRSKQAMRAERDRFAMLFENVPDAIAITHGEGRRVADVNPAFEETFGFDRETITDEPVDDYLIPDAGDAIQVIDEAGTDEVVRDEISRQGTDETREFLFKGFAIDGEVSFHEYGIYTDITERKRRERELTQYKRLVEAVGDPMFILDMDGRIEMVNEAMAEVVGVPAADVVGHDPETFMPTADVAKGTELLIELFDDGDRRWDTFEMAVEADDGDSFVAETKLSPLVDEAGEYTGCVGVIRDITRRKAREQRIRDLHEGTRALMAAEGREAVAHAATAVARDALGFPVNGVHLYDESVDGLVPVAHTDRALELLGDPPVIEADGGLIWEAYEVGDPIAHGDVTASRSVRNPETEIRSEAYIPLGEHGVVVVSSMEVNAFDEEELALAKILGANVEAALDRAEREATLAERTSELERQNERLDEFAGMVSHDLRNPLTLAKGRLDLACDCASAETLVHLSEIEWAIDRMDDLIADVLELARNGQPLTETTQVDLEASVAAAHRTVDADLDVAVEGSLGSIEASDQRVRALFENCLRNAVEHGSTGNSESGGSDGAVEHGSTSHPDPDGYADTAEQRSMTRSPAGAAGDGRDHVGPDVAVTVRRTDEGFAIDDDGPGIPVDQRETVLETGYTTATDGTGFGLAIVSDVAEAHGWGLTIEESPEGGARIHVRTDGS